jgi:hypothetical protein
MEYLKMCDYSLHAIKTRPATVGDKLVTSKFPHCSTQGFTAVGEPEVAVCLLPGTEIAFGSEAECRHPFARLFPNFGFGKVGERAARFRKIDMHEPQTHHDALEFANGRIVLLTQLRSGQHATVLQLPVASDVVKATREEKQIMHLP